MFRIVRVSATRLQGRYHGGSSRLYRTIRHYSKEQKQSELCPPPPPKNASTGTAFTLGALALASGAIIGYAKYDPDFRCILTEYVPFTDGVIKFVFQEEKSYFEHISDGIENIKKSLLPAPKQDAGPMKVQRKEVEQDTEKAYIPPNAALPAVANSMKEPEPNFAEIRMESKENDQAEPSVNVVEPRPVYEIPSDHPKHLAELEESAIAAAKNAVVAYHKAVFALKNYMADIEVVVTESVNRIDNYTWDSLRDKTRIKDETIARAESEAGKALKTHKQLRDLINRTHFDLPEASKEQALRNMDEINQDITIAKKELEDEKRMATLAEKYWKKVEAARQHFSDELHILFPSIDLHQKKVSIEEGDLDLFVLHAMAKVLYYQKELHRLETVGAERLRNALEAAKKGGLELLTTEQICSELEKERRIIEDEFQKKCLKLRQDSEKELRLQLKSQSQAFSDHLSDAIKAREHEIEKQLLRGYDEKLTKERCKFKEQIAGMIGRLRGLDHAMRSRSDTDKAAQQAQVLWAACQALFRASRISCPGLPWTEQIRPLHPEIKAVRHAAGTDDELVKAVIDGIPPAAKNRGVFPEDALRERFLKVEKIARGLALVPESGGRLHLYLLSYLQSFLLLKAANPIPQSELNDNETDFSRISTEDILQRARYWLDRGDFSQTLKYMNLLKGAPRAVARQWMEETRIMLETQQAANTLMAHATASGLLHL